MLRAKVNLLVVALAAGLLGAAAAGAQETNTIGPPQLRDFQLTPKQRLVTQPDPNRPPAQVAPPPPATQRPAAQRPTTTAPATRSPAAAPAQAPAQRPETVRTQPTIAPVVTTPPPGAQPQRTQPDPSLVTPLPVEVAPAPQAEQPAPAEAAPPEGISWWLYAIPLVLVALIGAAVLRRRRRPQEEPLVEAAPITAAPPPAPRPDPVPRPWLELELKTDRASFTETEAVIQFELSISNAGGSLARNLRIDVKMFNAGREQDQEIGAFFKTAGRQSTKLNLPGIAENSTGIIRGEVAMPLEEMKAVKLDGRMLFIPVVAVNALYDWGENRTGHSAKSYVVGRELEQSSEKMGAFRVDQGPRIWRTIGQRKHSLEKRV
jgi:hypothetical protein